MKLMVIGLLFSGYLFADVCQDMNPLPDSSPEVLAINSRLRPACTMRAILEHHRTHFPDDQLMVSLPGGGHMRNPYAIIPRDPGTPIRSPSVVEAELLAPLSAQSEAQLQQIIADVRESFIATIMNDTDEAALSPQQRLMIARIRSINVSLSTEPRGAEGSYSPQTNAIVLHPNSLKRPRLALAMLMSHEFGHSVDVCQLSTRKLRKKAPASALAALLPANLDRNQRGLWQEIFNSPSAEFLDTSAVKGNISMATLETMISRGLVEVVESGVPLQQNPSYEMYQCLSAAFPNDYRPIGDEGPCNISFIGEAGAQIWASRVMTKYITSHPGSGSHDGLGLFGISLPSLNKPVTGKEKDVDELYLHRPEFQALFDCTPVSGAHECR